MSENKAVRLWKGLQNPMFYGMMVILAITLVVIAIGKFLNIDLYWDYSIYFMLGVYIIGAHIIHRIVKRARDKKNKENTQ